MNKFNFLFFISSSLFLIKKSNAFINLDHIHNNYKLKLRDNYNNYDVDDSYETLNEYLCNLLIFENVLLILMYFL